jgi:hypothetical protein
MIFYLGIDIRLQILYNLVMEIDEIDEAFEKVSRGFLPHKLELDNWGLLQYIIFDGERIGVICERYNEKASLPKVYVERHKMHRPAYAKGISTQIFTLVKNHIQKTRDEQKKLAETTKEQAMRQFQTVCEERVAQLQNDGKIEYDRIKRSKSTESIYLYRDKKRILRISTHPSYTKINYGDSIIIKPEEVEKLEEFLTGVIQGY